METRAMKISYDSEADALYIRISDGEFGENREPIPGVVLDVGKSGELLGIEILEVSQRYPLKDLAHVDITMPLKLAEA
jgi:uncharacterized protein YuzE